MPKFNPGSNEAVAVFSSKETFFSNKFFQGQQDGITLQQDILDTIDNYV